MNRRHSHASASASWARFRSLMLGFRSLTTALHVARSLKALKEFSLERVKRTGCSDIFMVTMAHLCSSRWCSLSSRAGWMRSARRPWTCISVSLWIRLRSTRPGWRRGWVVLRAHPLARAVWSPIRAVHRGPLWLMVRAEQGLICSYLSVFSATLWYLQYATHGDT